MLICSESSGHCDGEGMAERHTLHRGGQEAEGENTGGAEARYRGGSELLKLLPFIFVSKDIMFILNPSWDQSID